jgi:Mg2+-importing ATPase
LSAEAEESATARAGAREGRDPRPFWSVPADDLIARLRTTARGLATEEALRRRPGSAASHAGSARVARALRLLLAQFGSPIVATLIAAAILSIALGDVTDALIILVIVLVSGLLGFAQEWRADEAVADLLALVR